MYPVVIGLMCDVFGFVDCILTKQWSVYAAIAPNLSRLKCGAVWLSGMEIIR